MVCRCGLSSPELIKAEYQYAQICSCLICSCLVHGQILLKQVTLRHAKSHAHPSLRNLKLEHNHAIDREAMAVKMRLAGKLTGEMQAQAQTGVGGVGGLTAFVGNPNTVRLPPSAGNSRKRGAAEGRGTRAGSKRTATSGS